jgi:hypothetical protein
MLPATVMAAPCQGGGLPYIHNGFLDLLDYGPNGDHSRDVCGRLSGDNANWADFGWDNRADLFVNNKPGHNAYIYDNYDWVPAPANRVLRPGQSTLWYDRVSSNHF